MTRLATLAIAISAFVACSDDTHYLIVSVTGRPAVHDAKTMKVTLSNEGSMRSDDFTLGHNFPVTFAVSSPDRMGDLGIHVEALDEAGLLVGRGDATSTFLDDSASVLLDSTDFVVNTTVADDQFLSSDFEANGNQLAAIDDGTWLVTFREACTAPCHMYGRRFDQNGAPLDSGAAAGTNAFPLSTTLTTGLSTPAAAGSGEATLAFWDYDDTVRAEQGVACRVIDSNGNASGTQSSVAIGTADVVSAAPLSNRNFAVVWDSPGKIMSTIVKPDCSPLNGTTGTTVATEAGTAFQRPVVAATNDGKVLFAWISAGSVSTRIAGNANGFESNEQVVIAANATDSVDYIRAIPYGDGFAIFARWTPVSGTGDGRIDMYRISKAGAALAGTPILITNKSGGEFASAQSFGAAAGADGTALVVWHACGVNGDDSGCGVFGRAVRGISTIGESFVIPTTTTADQTDPSVVAAGDAFVVAWNDLSMQEPDRSKLAVRARVVYLDQSSSSAR